MKTIGTRQNRNRNGAVDVWAVKVERQTVRMKSRKETNSDTAIVPVYQNPSTAQEDCGVLAVLRWTELSRRAREPKRQ